MMSKDTIYSNRKENKILFISFYFLLVIMLR